MTTEKDVSPHVVKMAKSFRSIGWWFLIVGSGLCVEPVATLFNPEATILVNGVPTDDFATKLAAAAFILTCPALGALLALTPKKKMEEWLAAFNRWAKAFAFGQK